MSSNPEHAADQQPQEVWLMPVFTPEPGREAELRGALLDLQRTSRLDHGCIEYSVYAVDGRFVLIEGWDSRTDLQKHNEQGHVRDFVALCSDLLAEPFTVTPMTPLV
ncbi:putative quinol monooxygenase [Sinomonas susongensis]|uniref:putative quinol monooxygenase n=1 Tax=Sinomonas susongensis TaxID=1324851 RepID=UPI001FECDEBB|nr:putative quinol monooxygenase [Sinomonas susongensis]